MHTEEMYTHENSSQEFREGYREGLEKAKELVEEYLSELRVDRKINEACWVSVALERLDDEHSMYIVGDEQ